MSHLGHRLSALIDGELGPAQRDRVLAHLAGCEPCRIEAASLRLLKQRMHTLAEATANSSLNERLLALATAAGTPRRGRRAGYPPAGRGRWLVRSLTVAGLMLLGAGVPAAAFMAGGSQQEPGPSVTPAVDLFAVQHAITAGQIPARTPRARPDAAPQDRSTRKAGGATGKRAARISPKLRVLSPAVAGAGSR